MISVKIIGVSAFEIVLYGKVEINATKD